MYRRASPEELIFIHSFHTTSAGSPEIADREYRPAGIVTRRIPSRGTFDSVPTTIVYGDGPCYFTDGNENTAPSRTPADGQRCVIVFRFV